MHVFICFKCFLCVLTFSSADCPNKRVVNVECEPKYCGQRSSSHQSYIVGGERASLGAWPWTVLLEYLGMDLKRPVIYIYI